jgi:hypothetical protein
MHARTHTDTDCEDLYASPAQPSQMPVVLPPHPNERMIYEQVTRGVFTMNTRVSQESLCLPKYPPHMAHL